MYRTTTLTLLLASLFAYTTRVPSAHGQDLSFADANSLSDQALAYAESIRKGDVLVRVTSYFEALDGDVTGKSPGLVRENIVFFRTTFDFDREQVAMYRSVATETQLLDESDANLRLTRFLNGVCYNSEKSDQVYLVSFPGGPSRFSKNELKQGFHDLLQKVNFRDCRYAFIDLRCSAHEDQTVAGLKQQQTGDTTVEISSPHQDVIEMLVATPPADLPIGWTTEYSRRRERYDVKSGFRIFFVDEGRYIADDGQVTNTKSTSGTTKVRWINELPVVVSGTMKYVTSFQDEGRKYRAPLKSRYDFHWISVNEDIDDALFDPAHLETSETILALLDPEKVGAKKLIGQPPRIQSDDDE